MCMFEFWSKLVNIKVSVIQQDEMFPSLSQTMKTNEAVLIRPIATLWQIIAYSVKSRGSGVCKHRVNSNDLHHYMWNFFLSILKVEEPGSYMELPLCHHSFLSVSSSQFESLMLFSLHLSLSVCLCSSHHVSLCFSSYFNLCLNICASLAVRSHFKIKYDINAKCCGGGWNKTQGGRRETVGVRGEAGEGQAALSRAHCFPPLIGLVLVPPLYYFRAPSIFAAVWRDRLIVLPCRGELQMARCSTPLSSLTLPLIFPPLFPIPNESRELIRKYKIRWLEEWRKRKGDRKNETNKSCTVLFWGV